MKYLTQITKQFGENNPTWKGGKPNCIDYNKENLEESNLISLCMPCHRKTNFNRDYWQNLLLVKTKKD